MASALLAAFDRFPSREALVEGSRSLSYAQLERLVAAVVVNLRNAGVQPGDGVALLSKNRIEAVALMLACWFLRVRYTPLHPLGSLDDQAFILTDGEISILVYDALVFSDRAAALASHCADIKMTALASLAEIGGEASLPSLRKLETVAPANTIAMLAYTGGTTGKPKGVILSPRSFMTSVTTSAIEWDWPQVPRFLACAPISHAAGLMIYPVLFKGGCLVLTPGFSATQFEAIVREQSVNATFLVPSMIYGLLDVKLHAQDVPSLELVIYGASSIDPRRLGIAIERLGPVFVQLYGQTEAPNCITTLRKADHIAGDANRLASCGLPTLGVDIALFDVDGKLVTGPGVGELCVRGPLLMDGYWRRPEETARALRDGWLRTGDVVRRDEDGFLTIIDRLKDVIITGGFNVYPREVELALCSHPDVADAAVVGLPDEKWGEQVAAAVVMRPERTVDANVLMNWMRDQKGSVQTPKRIVFVKAIDITGLGKPDRVRIAAAFVETG